MARTPAQRGQVGAWLLQARLARGYETQAVARRELERLTGWRVPQSQYAEWESGRRVPSEAALERLQGFYGMPEKPAAPEGTAGLNDLVAAVRAQTAELVTAIREKDAALARRDQQIESLLGEVQRLVTELGDYRQETLRSLTDALAETESLRRDLDSLRAAIARDESASASRAARPPLAKR